MTLTDKSAIDALEKARSYELEDCVQSVPEDERDERSDWQIVADEAAYLVGMYEDNTMRHDELTEARSILSRTHYGKVIPLDVKTLEPKIKERQIQNAKELVSEYKRLSRLVTKCRNMGLNV